MSRQASHTGSREGVDFYDSEALTLFSLLKYERTQSDCLYPNFNYGASYLPLVSYKFAALGTKKSSHKKKFTTTLHVYNNSDSTIVISILSWTWVSLNTSELYFICGMF